MRSWRVAVLLGSIACTLGATPALASSRLALPLMTAGERPTLLLAQRTIDRSWGPSEDSVYVELEIPEWRSEAAAMTFSAVVPGLGQAYAGDGRRGLWFAVVEVIGWTTQIFYHHRGREIENEAKAFVGVPTDPASRWSFERWAAATQEDPAQLSALYAADPETFYDLIATDPRYAAGWGPAGEENRVYFEDLLSASDERLSYAGYAETWLWLNHVLSAADALRTARLHNLALRENTSLKVKSGWRNGPTFSAALVRTF